MRNAKTSPLRRHGLKNGTNRDGNEGIRKGLGCTNRSVRMDYFPGNDVRHGGNWGPKRYATANKIARQTPAFPFHEDAVSESVAVSMDSTWTFRRWFDERDGSMADAREFMAGTLDAAEYEQDRYWDEWDSLRCHHEDEKIDRFGDLICADCGHVIIAGYSEPNEGLESCGTHYSVQQNAYGDWSTAIGRISLTDAFRTFQQMREFAWYDVRIVADATGNVVNVDEIAAVLA